MVDIKVDSGNDIVITDEGDIILTENDIRQAIKMKLQWIRDEWRLDPELGFPAFETLFVKNPNPDLIMASIREAIMEVEGVVECDVGPFEFDRQTRKAKVHYNVVANGETIDEEVIWNV